MTALIYSPQKVATQSGKGKTKTWRLEFDRSASRPRDPLMGWNGCHDTSAQVRLTFESAEDAIAYAKRNGIAYRLREKTELKVKSSSYSDNFGSGRKQAWTH